MGKEIMTRVDVDKREKEAKRRDVRSESETRQIEEEREWRRKSSVSGEQFARNENVSK